MGDRPHPRVAVAGGGMAGLEAAVAAASQGASVDLFEPGPQSRRRHVNWDLSTHEGDAKSRSWTTNGWNSGAGLSERLGGRSLCYHGVLLPIEAEGRSSWPTSWIDRLGGSGGLYDAVLRDLQPEFPELKAQPQHDQLAAWGLQHVPQAARLDDAGRFEAYSALTRVLKLASCGQVRIHRERVLEVMSDRGVCAVRTHRGKHGIHSGYQACILAASAIGNVQVLASSLRRSVRAAITDHFCVGAFVCLLPGPPITPFRHAMLWSGFVQLPAQGMNIFVLDRPPLAQGYRVVQLMAVIEQDQRSYSELEVEVGAGLTRTHVRAQVSEADRDRVTEARRTVQQWAETLVGDEVIPIKPVPGDGWAGPQATGDQEAGIRWSDHDDALVAVKRAAVLGAFAEYEVAYGGFEHEACTHPLGGAGSVAISPYLEVEEIPGVFVAGPGAFPRLGIANPALTIIAMARWLGARCGAL